MIRNSGPCSYCSDRVAFNTDSRVFCGVSCEAVLIMKDDSTLTLRNGN